MKKFMIVFVGGLCATVAHATDVATSQAYVDTVADTLQNNLPAKTADKVVTYTTTAGTTDEREIKTELGNESTNQSDTGIPTVGTVKIASDNKQQKLNSLSSVNVVTYTGINDDSYATDGRYGRGIVASMPIYDDTVNTFDNGLVTAKTLNDAIIAGVEAEVTRINTPKGALWKINRTAPKVLPTTANLLSEAQGVGYCGKLVQPEEGTSHIDRHGSCSSTMYDSMVRGDFGVTFSYPTGITYVNDTCVGLSCYKEIHGISACVANNIPGKYPVAVPPANTELIATLNSAYESGKSGATPMGGICYCKIVNPSVSEFGWWLVARTSVPDCVSDCAMNCAWRIYGFAHFRASMFGAVPVQTPTQSE